MSQLCVQMRFLTVPSSKAMQRQAGVFSVSLVPQRPFLCCHFPSAGYSLPITGKAFSRPYLPTAPLSSFFVPLLRERQGSDRCDFLSTVGNFVTDGFQAEGPHIFNCSPSQHLSSSNKPLDIYLHAITFAWVTSPL